MALSRTAMVGIGLGVVVVIVVVVALFGPGGSNTETTIVLHDKEGQCVVDEDKKDASATLKMARRMTWKIDDQCSTKGTLVTVGNFRMNPPSSASDCIQAVEGSDVFWPFAQPQALSHRQGTSKGNSGIQLVAKGRNDFSSARVEYSYDICTGANAEVKSDPRLVIEE